MSFFGGSPDEDNGIRPNENGPHKLLITVNFNIQPTMNDGSLSGIVVHDQTERYVIGGATKKKCIEKLIELVRCLEEGTNERNT